MKAFIITIISFLAISCSNKPTLQKYFGENTENKDFIAIDVSPSILKMDKASLSDSETKALDAFDKMNIIAFKKDTLNEVKYKDEVAKVKAILKDEEYQQFHCNRIHSNWPSYLNLRYKIPLRLFQLEGIYRSTPSHGLQEDI